MRCAYEEAQQARSTKIALQSVAHSAKDGQTLLLMTASPLVVNPTVYRNTEFDANRNFSSIAVIGAVPMALIATRDFPPNTMAEFVGYVRKGQANTNYVSVGAGSFSHVGMEMLAQLLNVKLTHIPYKGASPAQTDLIGGQAQFMRDSVASAATQVSTGRVKAFGVTSKVRSPFIQDIPAFAESGVAALRNFEIAVWVGLFAPIGTPTAVIDRLDLKSRPCLANQNSGHFCQLRIFAQVILCNRGSSAPLSKETEHCGAGLPQQ